MPKIKTVKLDLLNKKDLNKFIKSKEFKESKIAEEFIVLAPGENNHFEPSENRQFQPNKKSHCHNS